MRKFLFLLLIACAIVLSSRANNVRITSVSSNTTANATTVTFAIQWDNSWRGGAANNWDAVWVFIKVKNDFGWYDHLDLTGQNVSAPSSLTVDVPSDRKGCFIYRSANGIGNVTTSTITLGVTPKAGAYDLKVFGLEMVYIPEGSFWLGHSGGNSDNYSVMGTVGTVPYEITSATPPFIGTANGLYDARVSGTASFTNTWPTGFNAYYIMKHELSQGGYRDFLNAAPGYRNNIFPARTDLTSSNYQTINTRLFPVGGRNSLTVAASSSNQEGIGANANGNTSFNEANDGEWVACNFLLWSDAAAFLDWSALRPMTEFEYIKATNGPSALNYPQFASGTYIQMPNLSNPGILDINTNNERMQKTSNNPNLTNYINTNEMWGAATNGTNAGSPLRSGWAADANSNRVGAGASFYGVLDMSGNLWEPVVTSANAAGRSFRGNLGDGAFSGLDGNANPVSWPGNQNVTTAANAGGGILKLNTAGISKMGGSFRENLFYAVSDVLYNPAVAAQDYPTTRAEAVSYGCRGVRQVLP